MSGLHALFLLVEGAMKLAKPEPVVTATVQLGYPEKNIVGMGFVLLVFVVLYLVPRTSVLCAILLTGYLGGQLQLTCASAIHSSPTRCSRFFSECCFGAGFSCGIQRCARSFPCGVLPGSCQL